MITPIYILAEPIIYFKNIHNFIYIFFIMPRSYLPCGRSLSLHQIVHWLSDMYHSLYSTLLLLFRHIYPRTPGLPEDLFPLRCSACFAPAPMLHNPHREVRSCSKSTLTDYRCTEVLLLMILCIATPLSLFMSIFPSIAITHYSIFFLQFLFIFT